MSLLSATTGVLELPGVAFLLFQNVKAQKKYIQKMLLPELLPFQEKNDGSLKKEDFRKITGYYALGVPAILGYSFGVLRNAPLNLRERSCITYLGGISGLLDDLFDNPTKEVLHLESFILTPNNLQPANTHESLLKHCYISGLKNSANADALKEEAIKVFYSEKESKRQQGHQLSTEEIKKLTFLKGGHSFLFYRLCLSNPLMEKEKLMIFQLGGLMQMGNDIFDVWEDTQCEIDTLATKSQNITDLRNSFNNELKKAVEAVNHCNYPRKQLRAFTKLMLFGLARVYVCLDQFEKLQDSTSIFQPEKYSREQLICDMEMPKNKKAAIKHYLRLHSKFL